MRIFKYRMRFDTEWIDVSPLINSSDTEIKNSLCTTEYKSVTNTCSFTLIPSEGNGLFYAQIQEKLLQAKNTKTPIDIEISRLSDNVVLFGGYIDNSKLTVTSTKRPDKTSISGNDYIASLLDKKINLNLVYENKSILFIVSNLLKEAGYTGTVDASEALNGKTCKYFVTTDDDDATYRDVIDTLLFEIPGFVLYRNPATRKYEIRQIVGTAEPTRTVSYRLSDKLVTNTKIFDKDGIRIKYPTVDVKEGRPVYVDSVNEGSPAEIPAQHYYPENGDVQATLQEYDKNLLDRAYNTSESRLQNSDLDILYVKNAKLNIFPSNEDNSIFDFPVLQTLDMPSNPVWYPRKAWILLRNKTDKTVNLELMNIEGDVVYKSKINNITLPAKATDPAEYESSYIFDETHASEFARWYYHMQTIATTTSTWTEVNLESELGEKVIVSHKDSAVSQAHVVVQINNISLGGGVRGYKVTAVALSDFGSYEYAKDVRLNSSGGKTIFQEYNEYYNSDSFTELVGGTWSTTLTIDPSKTLWMRRVVRYIDGTYYYSTPAPSGSKGEDGQPGAPGTPGADGSYISFDISRTIVDYYADNYPVDNTAILFKAKSDLKTTIAIDGKVVTNSAAEVAYEVTPSVLFANKNSILATASNGKMQQTFSVVKNILTGSLSITADKTSVAYYADNVPHDANDKITLTVTSTNYKLAPKLYLNGQLQTTENSANYTFDVSQSLFKDTREITAKVTCGNESSFLTMTKVTDAGSISISCDKSEIGYYADNVPLNATEVATVSVVQTGYSKLPTLKINGIEKDYTTSVLTDSATYIIQASDLSAISKINAEISIAQEIQSVSVSKRMEQATISLTVSEGVAEYYYDNVAITGDMTATVTYSGLYYAPLLKAGEASIILDDKGQGTIPISLFDNADAGLAIRAYAQKYISYSTVVNIPKVKRPLVLSLGNSGSQFVYNNDNAVSPDSITLTNYTTGLSDKGKVTLVVGGELKNWTEGKFIVTPAMVIGRYLSVTISYGADSTSLIITKTYDGKAEIIEYSKTKSFKIYPDDKYEFVFNDDGLIYNGETMAWIIPWSKVQPDISSNEYLWRRSKTNEEDPWQYTRLTGIKGDDGKAGEYLGHYTEAPTTKGNGEDINDGDFYLNTREPGAPLPYIYKDGSWVLVTTDNPQWSQIASATMSDVNNYGGALLSTSAYYGYFQALSAQKAFIKSLGAEEITLNNGGAIQSSNYETSGGAEGFRIDSDGNANFSTGTWRGSFANGLSFVPPTKFKIGRNMTQKQAWQIMKKNGVVPGVYRGGTLLDRYYDNQPIRNLYYVNDQEAFQPPSFVCMDYDEEKVDATIPVPLLTRKVVENLYFKRFENVAHKLVLASFGYILSAWPIAMDRYLLLLAQDDTENTTASKKYVKYDGFYMLTKEKLEEIYQSDVEGIEDEINGNTTTFDTVTFRDTYLVKQTAISSDFMWSPYLKIMEFAIFPYYDNDNETFYMLMDNDPGSTGNYQIHAYHYTKGDTAVTYDGLIETGFEQNYIGQSWFICGYLHKINGKYQTMIIGRSGSQAERCIIESTDMKHWTNVQTVYTSNDDTVLYSDAIRVGTRTFGIGLKSFEKYKKGTTTNPLSFWETGFYEMTATSHSLINETYVYQVQTNVMSSMNWGTNLVYRDNKIYGSYNTMFFMYDLETNVLTDLTIQLASAIEFQIESSMRIYSRMDMFKKGKYALGSNLYIPPNETEPLESYYKQGCRFNTCLIMFGITNLAWDNKENALLLTMIGGDVMQLTVPFYYYPSTGKFKEFSFGIDTMVNDTYLNGVPQLTSFNLISSSTQRVFIDNHTFSLICNGISFNMTPKTFTNMSLNDCLDDGKWMALSNTINMSRHDCFIKFYYFNSTYYFSTWITFGKWKNNSYDIETQMRAPLNHARLAPDKPITQIDDTELTLSAIYPILDCRYLLVREKGDKYEICLPSGTFNRGTSDGDSRRYFKYLNSYGEWGNPDPGPTKGEPNFDENYTFLNIFVSSSDMVPFLTIDKNSEELMPATFYWNFPAQLTAEETIGKIIANAIQMPLDNIKPAGS